MIIPQYKSPKRWTKSWLKWKYRNIRMNIRFFLIRHGIIKWTIIIPKIKREFPKFDINEILSVQPMRTKTDIKYEVKYESN